MSSSDSYHRTMLARLSGHSQRSTSPSANSTSSRSSIPAGCREFHLRYARDSKGYDMSDSYSYSGTSSSASSTHGVPELVGVPTSSHDSFRRLHYAKDSRGVDVSTSYPYYTMTADDEALLLSTPVATTQVPRGCQDYDKRQSREKNLINRYAKQSVAYDFNASYPYTTSAMKA